MKCELQKVCEDVGWICACWRAAWSVRAKRMGWAAQVTRRGGRYMHTEYKRWYVPTVL
jgi:hypothetical protein